MNDQRSITERELTRFQGTWTAVAVEVDGSPVLAHLYRDARLVVAGERFSLWNPLPDPGERVEGSFRLDLTRTPKQLDHYLDGGRTVHELDDDTLRVCYRLRGGGRPAALATAPGSGLALVAYERV